MQSGPRRGTDEWTEERSDEKTRGVAGDVHA